jgi:hypothetical protein
MNRKNMDRRLFLGALGASLVGLAESRAAPGPTIKADAGSRPPLKFIGIYTPHGCAYELYKPAPDFDISFEHCTLSPFDDAARFGKSFKDKLLVIDHVDLTAGIEVGTVGHDAARVILTGSGAHGKNASVDQYLALEQGLGRSTPLTSLVLGIGHAGTDIGLNVSYAAGGTPMPKLIDPTEVFDELFGKPLTGKAREELEQDRRRSKSVLDFLSADLSALEQRAPSSERTKLDQHASALREIEKRLSGARPACDAPVARSTTEFPRLKAYGGGERHFDAVTDIMVDLLARALACDLTRFSTLFFADLSRSNLFPELPPDIHGGVAHRYHAKDEKNPGKAETWQALGIQNRYSYSKIARLMQRLDEAGIVDDCLLYASSDMGDPARHSSRHVPTLLLGGAGGHFKMGRYLELDPKKGTANNKILVSICQAFGVPTTKFGTSSSSSVLTGRLEELHA